MNAMNYSENVKAMTITAVFIFVFLLISFLQSFSKEKSGTGVQRDYAGDNLSTARGSNNLLPESMHQQAYEYRFGRHRANVNGDAGTLMMVIGD
jgi:hypothetical protein